MSASENAPTGSMFSRTENHFGISGRESRKPFPEFGATTVAVVMTVAMAMTMAPRRRSRENGWELNRPPWSFICTERAPLVIHLGDICGLRRERLKKVILFSTKAVIFIEKEQNVFSF